MIFRIRLESVIRRMALRITGSEKISNAGGNPHLSTDRPKSAGLIDWERVMTAIRIPKASPLPKRDPRVVRIRF